MSFRPEDEITFSSLDLCYVEEEYRVIGEDGGDHEGGEDEQRDETERDALQSRVALRFQRTLPTRFALHLLREVDYE
jgi:hypothetical protein